MSERPERREWDGIDRRQRQKWKLAKQITVGELCTFVAIAVGALGAVWEVRSTIQQYSKDLVELKAEQARAIGEVTRQIDAAQAALSRANEGIARLEERVIALQSRSK